MKSGGSPQLHARGHAALKRTAVQADNLQGIALHALKLPPPYPPLQLHICCAKGKFKLLSTPLVSWLTAHLYLAPFLELHNFCYTAKKRQEEAVWI